MSKKTESLKLASFANIIGLNFIFNPERATYIGHHSINIQSQYLEITKFLFDQLKFYPNEMKVVLESGKLNRLMGLANGGPRECK